MARYKGYFIEQNTKTGKYDVWTPAGPHGLMMIVKTANMGFPTQAAAKAAIKDNKIK